MNQRGEQKIHHEDTKCTKKSMDMASKSAASAPRQS